MSEELDNDLRNRIRQVFENYEDTTADEGWLLLREKFPKKKQRRAIAWYWATAALLLLCLGFGLWLNHHTTNGLQPKSTAKNNYHKPSIPKTEGPVKADDDQRNTPQRLTVQTVTAVKPATIQLQLAAVVKIAPTQSGTAAPAKQPAPGLNNNATVIDGKEPQLLVTGSRAETLVSRQPAYNLPDRKPGEVSPVKSTVLLSAEEQEEKKNEDAVMAMIKKDELNHMKEPASNAKENKRPVYSVYTATYVNYAKGSSSQFNAGGGFSTDLHLSGNLSLSTGLAVTQNTLSYTATPSAEAASTLAAAASKNILIATASYGTPSTFNDASPNLKNLNASLVGIDVPVNIKYFISPAKNDTYFSAGLSSGTFANETYNYKYNYSSIFNAAAQTVSTSSSFNSFYFANMANFSFGFGYPVGKSTRLIIEPFVKYPLSGFGAQQISFGAGGINLKINFLPTKK